MVENLPGHNDLRSTMVYMHSTTGRRGVIGPLDRAGEVRRESPEHVITTIDSG